MELRLISDCHLEISPQKLCKFLNGKLLTPDKNVVLCLCGDIGDPWSKAYSKFLSWCSESFEFVFVVAGNHEYYGEHNMEETDQRIQTLCESFKNVKFLQNSSFSYKDVLFIGATLWSNVPDDAVDLMNDYVYIPDISVELIRKKWYDSRNFLNSEISRGKKTVILTHHCPLAETRVIGEHKENYRDCYCSDLSFLARENVEVWFWGHTHHKFFEERNGTIFASNPKGYGTEDTGYDKSFSVRI
ncbi:calcineurin-like phosphoesterase [Brazilian marseillevirus]|uniref:metallo-phosphoesterase n=1 Tax=Brazilian marseillevirus TaxID=1813599 RepID=UPI00078309EA|nr:metallo-phosphoesterase [Brazilian marseillevirus]AMQ10919.1 calcineurin-like phosphoesterase [Brazilian marseillevirus]